MLDRIAGLWRRRKWIALLAFAAPASMVLGLVTSLPNIYRSTATILVERQQVPEAFVRPTVTGEVETRLQTITQEIFRVRSRQATGTANFLRTQLEETTKQLDVQERQVSDFNRRYMGELPQQMTANLAAIEQLSPQLRLNNDRQTLALARREALERQLADVETAPAMATTSGAPDTAATRLARLRNELRELRTQYTEKYPEVARVKAEIAALEREQNEKKSDAPSEAATPTPQDPSIRRLKAALTEVDAEVKALRKDESRLQAATARYQARADNTPLREQEFQELSRNYQTTKAHYQSLLKRYQEAQLAEDMEQRQKGEQFKIVDPAVVSDRPAAPNRSRFLLTGLILSLGLAAAAVVLAEQLDTSFHAIEELRAFTKIPVLVGIAGIATRRDTVFRRRRFRLATALAILVVLLLAGGSHLAGRGNATLVALLSPGGS